MSTTIHPGRTYRSALAALALTLASVVFAIATDAANAADASTRHATQRLVVRGEDTVIDGPCPAGVCPLQLTGGVFRGAPVGTGAYTGAINLVVAEAFDNGEGGVCAPIQGHIVLGVGTPDRLVLALSGDSCQDGAGEPPTSSFTGLARFTVKYGTGAYAKATGGGLMSSFEDANDREHMSLVGRISR
jgi:hypothetical protein